MKIKQSVIYSKFLVFDASNFYFFKNNCNVLQIFWAEKILIDDISVYIMLNMTINVVMLLNISKEQ